MTFSVDVDDLRSWADQVGRAGTDLSAATDYAKKNVNDSNFGRILDTITGEYGNILPKVHNTLSVDGDSMDKTRNALIYAADEYHQRDQNWAKSIAGLDDTISINDDGAKTNEFRDLGSGSAALVTPTNNNEQLPEVSLGIIYDRVCELISWVGGPDIRKEITDFIAGDVGKAATQASAWQHLAECIETVRKNLSDGETNINKTWSGKASTAEADYFRRWDGALTNQKSAMDQMSKYLKDSVTQAISLAQVLVDIVLTVVQFLSAAWTCAAIPLWGQWKLIKTVKEGIKTVWKAYTALNVFILMLKTIVDFIKASNSAFNSEALPAAPSV
ncbi:WXG100 family type VII secretion target [Nocardia nepalensis]|uniref:WXG100 family type VII secretion target n=1 Tax=Nocardia nepalensis TaxID=3375448 RepID=UPI003B67485B